MNALPVSGGTAGRLAVFAIADYRRLWLVGTVSSVVRWLDMLAMAVFAYQHTGSTFVVAMLTMLRMLPMGVLGLTLGSVGERVQRRLLLLAVMVLMALTAVVLAVLAGTGRLEVWHLAVASLLNGVAWASDNTVRRFLIGEVVGAARLPAAMSLDNGAGNAARMLGPVLGGGLLAAVGIEGAFALGAVLYLVPIGAAWRIGYRNPPVAAGAPALLARMAEGFAVVRRDRRLVGTMVITLIFNLWGWPATSMVPVIAADRLGLSPAGIGLLAGMDGLGALASAVALALWLRPAFYRATYAWGTALFLLSFVAFALAPEPVSATVALLAVGAASSCFGVMQSTLVYVLAPPEARSRVFGVLAVCIGTAPIGFLHLGLLADWLGASVATGVLGVEGLVAILLTRRWWGTI
ncbi:MAG: MFS transporter [Acetobacteraceae bacterium]|nr:MFS transporter [Acetobacteraceae bacterium]